MSDSYLIDTNMASGLIRRDPAAVNMISAATEVFVPCIVVGELYYGAHHSDAIEKQLARVDEFVAMSAVVYPDLASSRIYGRLKAGMRKRGQMMPENDLWIAALSVQLGWPVVTRDRHFHQVKGLTVLPW